jgi:hypothetical protein
MKARCDNPKHAYFRWYGGRGITYHPPWKHFALFEIDVVREIGEKPHKSLSFDRINNEGPYAPGNVRWATKQQQVVNTRSAHKITRGGITDTISGWARRCGVARPTLDKRIRVWGLERAFHGLKC